MVTRCLFGILKVQPLYIIYIMHSRILINLIAVYVIELLTIMLLVANLTDTKWKMMQNKTWKWLKPWHMGTHLRVLSMSYPMNSGMIGIRWFSKIAVLLCSGQK